MRPAGAYGHLSAGFNDPRAAYPLSNPQGSFMHDKALFLAQMPVQGPAVAAANRMHVGAKQVAI
jgi:hypothetical protein